jgi:hypothetical protein
MIGGTQLVCQPAERAWSTSGLPRETHGLAVFRMDQVSGPRRALLELRGGNGAFRNSFTIPLTNIDEFGSPRNCSCTSLVIIAVVCEVEMADAGLCDL